MAIYINAKKQVASARTYRYGGRTSVDGMTIAQLCELRCQTHIFSLSVDERSGKEGGRSGWPRAGQRIYYSQRELLENSEIYLDRIPQASQYMPESGDQFVSPETALYWLTMNTKNRACSDARVLKLAESMMADEWTNTGDPITFCTVNDGRSYHIISGQARLWAMWVTNCAVEHTIRYTTDARVAGNVDIGKTRSVSDLLSSQALPRHRILGGAAVLVLGYEENEPPFHGATTWEASPRYSANEILDWVKRSPEFVARIDGMYNSLRQCRRMFRSPVLPSALEYLLHSHSDDEVEFKRFWEDLETGVNLELGDPVLTLRETLLRDANHQKQLDKLTTAAYVIKAWNFRREDRRNTKLRWSPSGVRAEAFPTIL